MEYLAYIVTAAGPVIRRGITRNPAEWKPVAVADVINPKTPAYRFQLVDNSPAGGGIVKWDTDDVIGVTPDDRGDIPFADHSFLADTAAPSVFPDYREAFADSPFSAALEGAQSGDAEARLRADMEAHVRQIVQLRQIETASMLARHARELHDAMAGLDAEDDAAAYYAAEFVYGRAASQAASLGWPLDGNGVPLPECKDEA